MTRMWSEEVFGPMEFDEGRAAGVEWCRRIVERAGHTLLKEPVQRLRHRCAFCAGDLGGRHRFLKTAIDDMVNSYFGAIGRQLLGPAEVRARNHGGAYLLGFICGTVHFFTRDEIHEVFGSHFTITSLLKVTEEQVLESPPEIMALWHVECLKA